MKGVLLSRAPARRWWTSPTRPARRHPSRGLPAGPDLAPVSRAAPCTSRWWIPASAPTRAALALRRRTATGSWGRTTGSSPGASRCRGRDRGAAHSADGGADLPRPRSLRARRGGPGRGAPLQHAGRAVPGHPRPAGYTEPHYEGKTVVGEMVYVDRFGSLVTNLTTELVPDLRRARGRGPRARPAPAHLRRRAHRRAAGLRRLRRSRSRSRCGTARPRGGWDREWVGGSG